MFVDTNLRGERWAEESQYQFSLSSWIAEWRTTQFHSNTHITRKTWNGQKMRFQFSFIRTKTRTHTHKLDSNRKKRTIPIIFVHISSGTLFVCRCVCCAVFSLCWILRLHASFSHSFYYQFRIQTLVYRMSYSAVVQRWLLFARDIKAFKFCYARRILPED